MASTGRRTEILYSFYKFSLEGSPSGDQRCQDPLYSLHCCTLYKRLVQRYDAHGHGTLQFYLYL